MKPKDKRHVTLLDSLLDAIIRLDGDALIMHVGEKPYVVLSSASLSTFRGPLSWGQVELSSRALSADAVLGMVGQMLSPDHRLMLDEMGAIEQEIDAPGDSGARFMVTAARGGDDVWVEVRRKVEPPPVPAVEEAPVQEKPAEPVPEHLAPAAEYVAREAAADPVAAAPVARPHEVDIPLRPRFPQPLSEAGSAAGAYAGALPSIEMVDDVEQVPVSFEIDPNAEVRILTRCASPSTQG